jgi:hypothetical protein
MNSFSDIVGRKQTPEANLAKATDAIVRRGEASRPLVTKPVAQVSAPREDQGRATDFLIRGLVDRLPKPGSIWSLDDRAKWLRTAHNIFDLVYKADEDERRDISVVFVEQDDAVPLNRGAKDGSRD